MKAILLCFIVLINFSVYSQSKLPLRIVENTKEALTKPEHWYQLEVHNTSNKTIDAFVLIENNACKNSQARNQSELQFEIFDSNKKEVRETILLSANGKSTFYVKSKRTPNSKLGSWNCANITLATSSRTAISQTVELQTLIPNPSNFE